MNITTTIDCSNIGSDYCENDSDCVCKGYEGCFIGGRLYWENCVNKSEMCTDICPQDCNCIENKCNCTNYSWA